MLVRKTLTKEIFWDAMMNEFPNSMKYFCKWIDDYKQAVNWNSLFAANENTDQLQSSKYKFHDIPYAMQQGIWIAFAEDTISLLFEQGEYEYDHDLEENIKSVFNEIEHIIDEY